MKSYETVFIVLPTLTEDEERTAVERLSTVVQEGGGNLVVAERMGRRRLAYPILRHQDGVYVRFLYDAEPAVPKELERRIRLSDQILRSLTVSLEEKQAIAFKEQAVRDAQAREDAAREQARLEQEAIAAGLDPATVRAKLAQPVEPERPASWDRDGGDDADQQEDAR